MRRYLRCPGAICCPARRALRAVLQPHIRFCDKLIADALSPLPREWGASAHQLAAADAPWAASLADAFRIESPLTVALACATTLVLVRRREGSRCQPTSRPRNSDCTLPSAPSEASMACPAARRWRKPQLLSFTWDDRAKKP